MISGLIIGLIAAIVLKFMDNEYSYNVFQYTAFAWLIMSWGAWAGGVSMLFYACIESLMNKEWSEFKSNTKEWPSGLWQTNCNWPDTYWNLVHLVGFNGTNRWNSSSKRHRSKGNLFLRGGYIGDRLSPSKTWVFFMGACPVILIGVLWWNLFRMNQWPLDDGFPIAVKFVQLAFPYNYQSLQVCQGWSSRLVGICYSVCY